MGMFIIHLTYTIQPLHTRDFCKPQTNKRNRKGPPSPSNNWVLHTHKRVHRCKCVWGNPPDKECFQFPRWCPVSSSSVGTNSSPPVLGLWWIHSSDGRELHPLHQSPWWVKFSSDVIGLVSASPLHWLVALSKFMESCQLCWVVAKTRLETSRIFLLETI